MTKTRFLEDSDNLQSAAIRYSRSLIAPVQRERQWNASGKYERRQTQGGYNGEAGEKEFFTEIQLGASRHDRPRNARLKVFAQAHCPTSSRSVVIRWYQEHQAKTTLRRFRGIDLTRYQPGIPNRMCALCLREALKSLQNCRYTRTHIGKE